MYGSGCVGTCNNKKSVVSCRSRSVAGGKGVQISSGAARVIPGRGETGSTGNPNASRCSRASRNANTGNPGGKRLEGWEQDSYNK